VTDIESLSEATERDGTPIFALNFKSGNCAMSVRTPLGDAIAVSRICRGDPAKFKSALLHEGGHCATGAFYGISSSRFTRLKCEYKADRHVARERITAEMVETVRRDRGITETWEFAEYFGVTEEYMGRILYLHGRENNVKKG
jgi:hypothetical protein